LIWYAGFLFFEIGGGLGAFSEKLRERLFLPFNVWVFVQNRDDIILAEMACVDPPRD